MGGVLSRKAVRSPPIDGFALHIGQRAALFPTPGAKRRPKPSTSTYSSVRPIAGCIHADLRKKGRRTSRIASFCHRRLALFSVNRHHCASPLHAGGPAARGQ
jgi:hypothetical protein